MNQKYLYEFVVEKEVEKQISEKKMEGEKEITITRTEKVKEPTKFAILKPGRKLADAGEIFLAKMVSFYIKEGIMPISLVAKRFGNDGGVLTESESKNLVELNENLEKNQKALLELNNEKGELPVESTAKQTDILMEMLKIQTEIDRVKNAYFAIYDNTAEMKARKKTIEWWILTLAMKENSKGEYENYFKDKTFEDSYMKYINILDGEDVFEKDVCNKFTYLISSWINSDQLLTPELFKSLDENFEEKVKESVR